MRIPSFSISRLFLAITVCALLLAVVLYLTQEYRRQLAARLDLQEMGAGWVGFNSEKKISLVFKQNLTSDAIKKYSEEITSIECKLFSVQDEHLENLSTLKSLSTLLFVSADLEKLDLAALQNFSHLDYLVFWKTELSDSQKQALAALKNTSQISFISVNITASELDDLRASLPETRIVKAK